MRNFRTSKYKKPKYFVNKNKHQWEVVEFPTNDIIRVFKRKIDAEMFSEQLTKNPNTRINTIAIKILLKITVPIFLFR